MKCRIWDNGAESIDRYTVVIEDSDGTLEFYGMSELPHEPQGFNQYLGSSADGYTEGPHLGRTVTAIPKAVVIAILERTELAE